MDAATIVRLREHYKMSQVEFAHYLGVTEVTVKGWESGDESPTAVGKKVIQLLIDKTFPKPVDKPRIPYLVRERV